MPKKKTTKAVGKRSAPRPVREPIPQELKDLIHVMGRRIAELDDRLTAKMGVLVDARVGRIVKQQVQAVAAALMESLRAVQKQVADESAAARQTLESVISDGNYLAQACVLGESRLAAAIQRVDDLEKEEAEMKEHLRKAVENDNEVHELIRALERRVTDLEKKKAAGEKGRYDQFVQDVMVAIQRWSDSKKEASKEASKGSSPVDLDKYEG